MSEERCKWCERTIVERSVVGSAATGTTMHVALGDLGAGANARITPSPYSEWIHSWNNKRACETIAERAESLSGEPPRTEPSETIRCPRCEGEGDIRDGDQKYICPRCGGRGYVLKAGSRPSAPDVDDPETWKGIEQSYEPAPAPSGEPQKFEQLRREQLDAEQAWEFLQSKGVKNLDIEREGKDKVTLTELLAEFGNGVYIGRDESGPVDLQGEARRLFSKMFPHHLTHITVLEALKFATSFAAHILEKKGKQ